jgi:crotonobetainyl-CoA:carnitine CoA-transferase CaiB-like acyl-CoA transferase
VQNPVLSSSFHVGLAAQTSIASAALAAAEIWFKRTGSRQRISVSRQAAEYECTGYFTINGRLPTAWAKISGLYPCRDGHVRIHANFDHHRDGILNILGLAPGGSTEKKQVEAALRRWDADKFETAAAESNLVVSKVRSFAQWDKEPQAAAIAGLPLLNITKIGEAQAEPFSLIPDESRPLEQIRVLDLTRILAGPICGRTLAAYGAQVMLVNSPNLPNIEHIIDTSRGKLSVLIDLEKQESRQQLRQLVRDADVFVQGYRPGGLQRLGFTPEELARERPGLIYVSLSAYSHQGPWANRRGFDSLVQTATGFNHAEAEAAGSDVPKAMPVQILDYASGFFMAFAAQVALLRRAEEGGSWHVQVSLAQTAQWLRNLGRVDYRGAEKRLQFNDVLQTYASGFGELKAMPHAAQFSKTSSTCIKPSVPPGTQEPSWNLNQPGEDQS